ncbi:MAG: 30S ribosomal protein S12 methylthiotransferase RimO [Phycisphaerae bacterium]
MSQPKPEIRTVAFVSLGCAKNLVDSERMLGLLASDGLAITADEAEADAVVINTCGFLEASREESLAEIRHAVSLKQAGSCKRVIVAGCLVQRHKTKLLEDVPEIDRLVGVFDREHIVAAVRGPANPRSAHGHYLGKYHDLSNTLAETQAADPEPAGHVPPGASRPAARLKLFEDDRARLRLTPRHYAYLRISEGCNQGCAFCTIPGIRGPMRSKPIEQILAEGNELAADGAVELNLIGQDTTSYGTDIAYSPGLAGLLKTLDARLPADVEWVRLMYAYPSCFTDEMIDALASSARLVKYIDMPLQHINDRILTLMKRKVTREQTQTLLGKLRDRVPGIAIRTTLIAGSPTETDAEHGELVQWVREMRFDALGVFPYSPEPGTPMGRMPAESRTPDDVIKARVEELMLTQQEVAFARAADRVGTKLRVLIDSEVRPEKRTAGVATPSDEPRRYVGRHAGQAVDIDSVTYVQSARRLTPGTFVDVDVTDFQAYDLVAEVPAEKRRPLAVL